jgi:hypothetical protein
VKQLGRDRDFPWSKSLGDGYHQGPRSVDLRTYADDPEDAVAFSTGSTV